VIQSGNTSVMPPVPLDPEPVTEVFNSVSTGPSVVVGSALDVTMETPEPPADQTRVDPAEEHRRKIRAQRERPALRKPVQWRPEVAPVMSMQTVSENGQPPLPPRRPRNRPRTLDSWKATLADIRHDRQTPFYITLIILAAVLVCWATMVIFKPDWVPQVINPIPAHPGTTPASYHPEHEPLVPGGGLRTLQTRSERPAGTPGPSGHRRRSETPHKGETGQPVPGTTAPSAPADPSQSPTEEPGGTPSSSPTHSSEPTPSDPGTPTEPTREPTHSQSPSHEPTETASASPTASRSASDSPEPTHSASESPVTSPSATSS
jgi:hypothetical protein